MKQLNKIQSLFIDEVSPSFANTLIYRPVRSDDPAIIELAQSIREHGILEPLIVTKDGVIISGHRRYTAARLAGPDKVPCWILPMEIDDPRFTELLTTCNQQRVKTLDEFMAK
jgi:ParB family chromosome partitioning protein